MSKLLALLICFFSMLSMASEKPVSIGLVAIEPYVVESNGVFSGEDYRFFKILLAHAKLRGTFQAWPLKRFLANGYEGRFDIAMDLAGNPGMQKYYIEVPTPYSIFAILVSDQEKIQALKSALHRMEQEKTYDIYKANKSSGIVK